MDFVLAYSGRVSACTDSVEIRFLSGMSVNRVLLIFILSSSRSFTVAIGQILGCELLTDVASFTADSLGMLDTTAWCDK
jgi:hypothetical protein